MQSKHMHTSSIEEGRKARDCDPPTAVIPPPLHVHPQPLAPTRPRTPPTPGAHPANEQDEGCPSHGSGFHRRRGVITTPYLPSLGTGARSTTFDAAVGRPLLMQRLVDRFLMQRWVDRF